MQFKANALQLPPCSSVQVGLSWVALVALVGGGLVSIQNAARLLQASLVNKTFQESHMVPIVLTGCSGRVNSSYSPRANQFVDFTVLPGLSVSLG